MAEESKLVGQFRAARRAGVPLVVVTTSDQFACMSELASASNGKYPIISWDIASGPRPLNSAGEEAISQAFSGEPRQFTNLSETLPLCANLPKGSIIFILNAHYYLDSSVPPSESAVIRQACLNLRDVFKSRGCTLIALCPYITLPQELANEFVLIDDPLPTPEQIGIIVDKITSAFRKQAKEKGGVTLPELSPKTRDNATDALRGLSAFLAEQILSMSLSAENQDWVDLDLLWREKKKKIEQTKGLKIDKEKFRFADMAGAENTKDLVRGVFEGREPFKIVVRIEEIEKAMAGAQKGSPGDSSGVSQDALQVLLNAMEDNSWRGMVAVGVPGSGKSLIAKAIGGEFGVLSISADLGAMKGSLVGQSEQEVRQFVKMIYAIAGEGGAFFVATSNDISAMRPELIDRFSFGVWEFEKPDREQRLAIWRIHLEKYGLGDRYGDGDIPPDEGWVGRNIRNCVEVAYRLNCGLKEASRFVSVGGKFLKANKQEAQAERSFQIDR